MGGKGVLKDHSQPRACSGKKTLRSCVSKRNCDHVVLIDVDADDSDEVINIDVPESLRQKNQGRSIMEKGREIPVQRIISIDDDESNQMDSHEISMGEMGDLDSDATSSKCHFATDHKKNFVDSDDECQVIREEKSAMKSSGCKENYAHRKSTGQNRYGLFFVSDSGSSKCDSSDCELMDDFFGEFREQWEKAFIKRTRNVDNCRSSVDDQASASGSTSDTHKNIKVANKTSQPFEDPACSGSANVEKGNPSAFVAVEDDCLRGAFLNREMRNPFVGSSENVSQESFSWFETQLRREKTKFCEKSGFQLRGGIATQDLPLSHAGRQNQKSASGGETSPDNQVRSHQQPSFSFESKKGCTVGFSQDKTSLREGCFCTAQPTTSEHIDCRKATIQDDITFLCKCPHSGSKFVNNERVISNNKHDGYTQPPSNEPLASHKQPFASDKQPFASTWTRSGMGTFPQTSFDCNLSLRDMSEVSDGKASLHETEKPNSVEASFSSAQPNEEQIKQGGSDLAEAEELLDVSTNKQYNQSCPLKIQGQNATHAVEIDIINERERLKETDDYKRAVEAEWASRQRQLQIQAEESQRLRKKKRAESMRLLDMERRQKQRVEEMRETQKKDQENMNLKERLRAEVRRELHKLEMTCIDMTSLLRGLGIHVGGGFFPLSQEVHAAYKKALLKFHPDRASRTDIRQQVEAEEKFKLISRMKEKFLLPS